MEEKLKYILVIGIIAFVAITFFAIKQNQTGAVVRGPPETFCNGIDNDKDGLKDDGCDDDNDNYCDSGMTRASPYSCSGTTDCCPLGGGDCADAFWSGNNLIHPGATENCLDIVDNDCDGVVNEGCTVSCIPEICDGLDNDCDTYVDEYCDSDNDDWCSAEMTRASPYSCSGTTNCCPLGGGDCASGTSSVYPGATEDCFDFMDNNCDGVTNCPPYSCSDSDTTNNVYVGGAITITSPTGATYSNYRDSCASTTNIAQVGCISASGSTWYGLVANTTTSCPAGTTCTDPSGSTPATCVEEI